MAQIRDCCRILEGKLPLAPAWPRRTWWKLTFRQRLNARRQATSPAIELTIEVGNRDILWIDHAYRQFRGRPLVDLLRWVFQIDPHLDLASSPDDPG